jgi:lipoprotein-anchoring transpeptidase ErfK/SrfK
MTRELDCYLHVEISRQRLSLREAGRIVAAYPVSTARNGSGELKGSYRTPRGWHVIRAKIGAGLPRDSVLVGRRPTGEIYTEALAEENPGRDWILTRILWLDGLEPGFNRYGSVDTGSRYIYIHGTPTIAAPPVPQSHGCIRMASPDLLDLFDRVSPGCRVLIEE